VATSPVPLSVPGPSERLHSPVITVCAERFGLAVTVDVFADGGHWRCAFPARLSPWAIRETADNVSEYLNADREEALTAITAAVSEVAA